MRHQFCDFLQRLAQLRLGTGGRINHVVTEEFTLGVEDGQFAAGPKTGIDRQHFFLAQRRGQQQFADILDKNPDRLDIGSFLGGEARIGFQRQR